MDDAMLNRMLIRQQVNIDNFTENDAHYLDQAKHETNGSAITLEQFSLLVGEFHHIDSFGHLWVKYQMESKSARNLDIEYSKTVAKMIFVTTLLIGDD